MITVPKDQLIWRPAIIRMPEGGELELDFHNADHNLHAVYAPSSPERQMMLLPMEPLAGSESGWIGLHVVRQPSLNDLSSGSRDRLGALFRDQLPL